MSQRSTGRRIANVAAFGGGGLGAVGVIFTGVLIGQALIARRSIPLAESPPPRSDGRYGTGHPGQPITLAVLGDSTAAGYGVDAPRHTTGALLAAGLAEQLHRPVNLRCYAIVGAESEDLPPQVEKAVEARPDLALIMVGGNDVTHRRRIPDSVAHLVRAVRALRAVGTEVVVGTCPDLGTIKPLQRPLRWLATRWSRRMATAQTIAVVEAGGRTVSLGALLGPAFAAEPDRMFSSDQFHPSADGYSMAAAALLPTLVAALGVDHDEADLAQPRLAVGEGVRSLPEAAAAAAGQAGTEVSRTQVAGRERGPTGRWAELRLRVWRSTEHPSDPAGGGSNVRLPGQQSAAWSET